MRISNCNFIGKNETIEVASYLRRYERKMEIHKRKRRRANGGCLGYPEARKDVVSCEKQRGAANRP